MQPWAFDRVEILYTESGLLHDSRRYPGLSQYCTDTLLSNKRIKYLICDNHGHICESVTGRCVHLFKHETEIWYIK